MRRSRQKRRRRRSPCKRRISHVRLGRSRRSSGRCFRGIEAMEVVGLGFYFEDLPVGRKFRTIGRTVTEADITAFVNCTGMVEVLFTNREFLAHESDIKKRLAPAAVGLGFS